MKPKVTYKELCKEEGSSKYKIVKLLLKKPMCVNDIAKKLQVSQPRASEMAKKLHIEKILTRKKIKNFVFYGVTEKVRKQWKEQ